VPKKRLSPAAAAVSARMKALHADPEAESEFPPQRLTARNPAGPSQGAGRLETGDEDARGWALLAEQEDPALAPAVEAARSQSLWQEVLLQALRDLLKPNCIEAVRAQDKWLSWIGTRDFREVCDLAGVDAEATGAMFKAVAEGDVVVREQVASALGYVRSTGGALSLLGRNRRAGKRGQSVRYQSSAGGA